MPGVRWVLRLDGRGARRGRRPVPALAGAGEDLGPAERLVMAKYGVLEEEAVKAPAAAGGALARPAAGSVQAGYEADADTEED